MRDRFVKSAAFGGLLAFGMVPFASAYTNEDVQGRWDCLVRSTDLSMEARFIVTFQPGGKAFADGEMNILDPEFELSLNIDYTYDYDVVGDMISERNMELTVGDGTLNGTPVTNDIKAALEAEMDSTEDTSSELIYRGDDALIFRGTDDVTTCLRPVG